ncbi:MAG: hypothetical protein KAI47_11540, partial [Deltaproteobacteria bacterium]|nr:hypothetical protein [Deltaproteobacteria bacterium]
MDRPPRSTAHPDAVRGDLGHYPAPRILFHLLRRVFTGILEIDDQSGRKTHIFFREGLPCFADLASAEDVLGRVLLERGLINQDQYNQSLQELSLGGKLQGQILIGMGALTEAQLIEGLKLQLHRKVNRLFYCPPTTPFAIFTENHTHGLQGEAVQVRIDPLYVICQGVRNAFRAPQLTAELEKLSGSILRLHDQFPQIAPRFAFAQEERPLLDVLQADKIPYERVYRITNLSPIETQMLLYTLWVTEMLTVEPNPMAIGNQGAQPIAPTKSQTAQ